MFVLALDSSQIVAQVALLRMDVEGENGANTSAGVRVLASAQGAAAVSQSQSLLPLIDDVLKQGQIELSQVGALAAGVGPGSFTGLRIGLATARSMAQALGLPVISFSSLRCLAHAFSAELSLDVANVVAVVDAYQGQIFAGWQNANTWEEDSVTPQGLIERLRKTQNVEAIHFAGSGVVRYSEDFLNAQITVDKLSPAQISADSLAAATLEAYKTHGLQNLEALTPQYLRPSAADLNLAAALQKG